MRAASSTLVTTTAVTWAVSSGWSKLAATKN